MVSVIIPTYNRASTIERAIDSVLKQTYVEFELLIVDDGSTDNTEEIVRNIKDKRIKYIKRDNGGAAAARNTGVQKACYDYIAFQDSDDYWYPTKLEKQMEMLIDNNADATFCKLKRHNYSKNEVVWPNIKEGFVESKLFLESSLVSTQTLVGKKEVFMKYPFRENLPALEDFAFSIEATQEYNFYHVDEVLVDLYLQEDSLTKDMGKYYDANLRIMEECKDIWKLYPKAEAKRWYIIGCLANKLDIKDVYAFKYSFEKDKKMKTFIKLVLFKIKNVFNIK